VLTEKGNTWYREAFGQEPAESEIVWAARTHRSAPHGVGILEARDHLRALGYPVDDAPEAILSNASDPWGQRTEPDLVMWIGHEMWPVEVQREVSERLLDKWSKALSRAKRLILILFNEEHCDRQHQILEKAARDKLLPPGEIMLASLEEMEWDDWRWFSHTIDRGR
jgi:hypothetical protein